MRALDGRPGEDLAGRPHADLPPHYVLHDASTSVGLATVDGAARLTPSEEATIRQDAWFASLDPALQQAILARSTVRRLRARTVLARGQGVASAWYGIAAGAVRLGTCLASGQQVNFQLVEPGAWIGDIPIIDGLATPCDVETWTDSTLLVVRKDDMVQLLADQPGFGIALARLNGRRTRHLMELFAEAISRPLENRIARQLLHLARRFGRSVRENHARIHLRVSQQDLADLLGASRQRVNAGLKKLERDGLLQMASGRWDVLDLEALEALADQEA